MPTHPVQQLTRHAIQTSIWVVLLMLSLGLPRFVVVCSGPHCAGSIELVHASGACCEHAAPAPQAHTACCDHADHGDGDGDAAAEVPCGCTDEPLGLEEGPLPTRSNFAALDAPANVPTAWSPPHAQARSLQRPQPHATGPPRTDRRTELLASTVLLL